MKRSTATILVAITCLLPPAASSRHAATYPETVTVVPEETDELLANPGMGWQTFHRTRDQDRNLPEWLPSTVHYARWGWGTLEPQPGEIDYPFLDFGFQIPKCLLVVPGTAHIAGHVLVIPDGSQIGSILGL